MVSIAEISRQARRIAADRYHGPKVLRVAPDVGYQVQVEMAQHSIPHPHVLGMDLVTDEHLPHGVWRLCDADQTLLYDCREGTSPQ